LQASALIQNVATLNNVANEGKSNLQHLMLRCYKLSD